MRVELADEMVGVRDMLEVLSEQRTEPFCEKSLPGALALALEHECHASRRPAMLHALGHPFYHIGVVILVTVAQVLANVVKERQVFVASNCRHGETCPKVQVAAYEL